MTLLLDALDRSLKEPECARRWHSLMAIWAVTPDEAARRAVLDVLENLPLRDARTDILRLTFLAGATGASRFEYAAAARVLAAEPTDPDRLAAFMAYQWLSALQNLEGRSDFMATLSAGLLPEMVKRLMQNAAKLLPPTLLPGAPEEIQRIAVVVPYLGDQFHTPSMMAIAQCAILAREGRQIHIFSAQELMPPDASLFRGDGRELVLPPLNAQALASILPAGVGMTISDSRFSLPGRWRNLMPVLADFNPDVVLMVGLYSPLAAALHAVRPVVGISVNTVAPIGPVDVWLTANAELERGEVWGGIFPPPQPVYHPWRMRRSGKQWSVTRAEFGLSATTVIWVTAGFRLEHEIKGEWASRILQLMSRHPQVVWLLVGGQGKLPHALLQAQPGRVRALSTRDDLPGILRYSDIYVNPPRMGGGFSVAEAMAEGLPVTALAGSDGGDKLGDLALPDMDAYMERLAALTEDPGLRAGMGEALRQRFAERFDLDASGPALLAACRQAAVLARARLKKPS
ncbi:MAG: glycosyltransferase [Sulfuritalea sp.]|jgi:glycosyltransferase involved in cell wall biosynthesis|nr:glycosyltransferase [Sulfuritalea sp.]